MKPGDLIAEEVRIELETLIRDYPDRTGSILANPEDYDYDETTCVYFADENNAPISFPSYGEVVDNYDDVVLKTPVCIVGQWIETFHPEFKTDETIRGILLKNNTMRHADAPFAPDVKLLLTRAQDQQDINNTPWGVIDLDNSDY